MNEARQLLLRPQWPSFNGRTQEGQFIVRHEGTEYHYEGICYRVAGESNRLSLKKQRSNSPAASERNESTFDVFRREDVIVAQGASNDKLFVIHGKVTAVIPLEAVPPRSTVRQPMSVAQYQVEVQRIKASQELGIDPMVALPFLMRHSGRSAATVYRDISAGRLPLPCKRGASSVWAFSAADAYARGQQPASACLTA